MKSIALFLVVPLVVLPPTSAAAETCQGRAATVVGTYGEPLAGTEGGDVIMTNGASPINALGGDDLVCVTGRPPGTLVDAGPGDDVVDAGSAFATGAGAVLGTGADRYIGSSARDMVLAGDGYLDFGDLQDDSEIDDIDTGPHGPEGDLVVSGQAGAPNSDRVVMGSGQLQWAGLATPAAYVDGGVATQLELTDRRSETVAINAVAGTAVVDSVHSLTFRNISRFRLVASGRAPRQLTYLGGPYLDELDIVTAKFPHDARHSVSLGGGNDELRLESYGVIPVGVSYDAGVGRHDTIGLTITDERKVAVDLGRGRLTIQTFSQTSSAAIPGFEDADVRAKDAELVGTSGRNILRAHACRLRIRGGAGSDQLTWLPRGSGEELLCQQRAAHLFGGGGRDFLKGSTAADRLYGGPGPDTAVGRAGRDTCRAETVRSCEVRRQARVFSGTERVTSSSTSRRWRSRTSAACAAVAEAVSSGCSMPRSPANPQHPQLIGTCTSRATARATSMRAPFASIRVDEHVGCRERLSRRSPAPRRGRTRSATNCTASITVTSIPLRRSIPR